MHRRKRILLKAGFRHCLFWLILPTLVLLLLRVIWRIEATHRLDKARAALLAAEPPFSPPPDATSLDDVIASLWGENVLTADQFQLLRRVSSDDFDATISSPDQQQLTKILAACTPVFNRIDDLSKPSAMPLRRAESRDHVAARNTPKIAVATISET